MLMIDVDYPSASEEIEIVKRTTVGVLPEITPVLDQQKILALQAAVQNIPVGDHVIEYAVDLVRATRPDGGGSVGAVQEYVAGGAGPRASQYRVMAGKARALADGRLTVSREDVRALAHPVLKHRVVTNFHAEAERITSADLIDRILEARPIS